MIPGGITERYAEAVITGGISAELLSLLRIARMYILKNQYTALRARAINESAITLLTGLLSEQNLMTVRQEDLQCRPIGRLQHKAPELLPLGICCGRTLLTLSPPTLSDETVFRQNQVRCLSTPESIASWIILHQRSNRLLNQWTLTDGGLTTPTSVLSQDFSTARDVIIYDRYFTQNSIDVLKDIISGAASLATQPITLNLTIAIGNPQNNGTNTVKSTILRQVLGADLDTASTISVNRIVKLRGSNLLHLHDRFIQIDNAYSYVFSAGLDCFYSNSGQTNRSSSIYRFSIHPDYVEYEYYLDAANNTQSLHKVRV